MMQRKDRTDMLDFIDARCMLGRTGQLREGAVASVNEIIQLMEHCNITQAVAYHSIAKECDLLAGNEQLIDATKDYPMFLRQWCVMPNTFGEFLKPENLLQKMKENHVTSVRMFPKTCDFSLHPRALGKLMRALTDCHVPVFIDLCQLDWESLYRLCRDYPQVSIVLTEPGYRGNRQLESILLDCPNLYLGTSNYVIHNGLETFCKYFDASRLIFESGIPTGSACASVALVNYANISKEEKELIAHGNISRLLSEVCL